MMGFLWYFIKIHKNVTDKWIKDLNFYLKTTSMQSWTPAGSILSPLQLRNQKLHDEVLEKFLWNENSCEEFLAGNETDLNKQWSLFMTSKIKIMVYFILHPVVLNAFMRVHSIVQKNPLFFSFPL